MRFAEVQVLRSVLHSALAVVGVLVGNRNLSSRCLGRPGLLMCLLVVCLVWLMCLVSLTSGNLQASRRTRPLAYLIMVLTSIFGVIFSTETTFHQVYGFKWVDLETSGRWHQSWQDRAELEGIEPHCDIDSLLWAPPQA